MAFEKGHSKLGGKTKGSENKVSKAARELFLTTLEGEVEHISASFAQVRETDPAKYLDLFAKYAQYFMPKKLDISNSDNQKGIPIATWANKKNDNGKK